MLIDGGTAHAQLLTQLFTRVKLTISQDTDQG